MELSQVLKAKRTAKQMTQEQLAAAIFVSKKTISNWENGRTTPDIDSLIRLARLFDLSLDQLLQEGSEIVENIKRQAELKETRLYGLTTFITNFVLLFTLITQGIFGTLPLPIIVALVIAEGCNLVAMSYFLNRMSRLEGQLGQSAKPTKGKTRLIIAFIITIVLVGIVFIISIPFFF